MDYNERIILISNIDKIISLDISVIEKVTSQVSVSCLNEYHFQIYEGTKVNIFQYALIFAAKKGTLIKNVQNTKETIKLLIDKGWDVNKFYKSIYLYWHIKKEKDTNNQPKYIEIMDFIRASSKSDENIAFEIINHNAKNTLGAHLESARKKIGSYDSFYNLTKNNTNKDTNTSIDDSTSNNIIDQRIVIDLQSAHESRDFLSQYLNNDKKEKIDEEDLVSENQTESFESTDIFESPDGDKSLESIDGDSNITKETTKKGNGLSFSASDFDESSVCLSEENRQLIKEPTSISNQKVKQANKKKAKASETNDISLASNDSSNHSNGTILVEIDDSNPEEAKRVVKEFNDVVDDLNVYLESVLATIDKGQKKNENFLESPIQKEQTTKTFVEEKQLENNYSSNSYNTDYSDLQKQSFKPVNTKKSKKPISKNGIILSIIALVIAAFVTVICIVEPLIKYNKANELLRENRFAEAEDILFELEDYKDSERLYYLAKAGVAFRDSRHDYAIEYAMYAGWSVEIKYTNYQGDSIANSVKLSRFASKSEIRETLNPDSLVPGYECGSWTETANFNYDKKHLTYTLATSIREIEYNIYYDLNGGENSPNNIKSYTINTSNFELKPATRFGYKFLGWYDAIGNKVKYIYTNSLKHYRLEAKWEFDNNSLTTLVANEADSFEIKSTAHSSIKENQKNGGEIIKYYSFTPTESKTYFMNTMIYNMNSSCGYSSYDYYIKVYDSNLNLLFEDDLSGRKIQISESDDFGFSYGFLADKKYIIEYELRLPRKDAACSALFSICEQNTIGAVALRMTSMDEMASTPEFFEKYKTQNIVFGAVNTDYQSILVSLTFFTPSDYSTRKNAHIYTYFYNEKFELFYTMTVHCSTLDAGAVYYSYNKSEIEQAKVVYYVIVYEGFKSYDDYFYIYFTTFYE